MKRPGNDNTFLILIILINVSPNQISKILWSFFLIIMFVSIPFWDKKE